MRSGEEASTRLAVGGAVWSPEPITTPFCGWVEVGPRCGRGGVRGASGAHGCVPDGVESGPQDFVDGEGSARDDGEDQIDAVGRAALAIDCWSSPTLNTATPWTDNAVPRLVAPSSLICAPPQVQGQLRGDLFERVHHTAVTGHDPQLGTVGILVLGPEMIHGLVRGEVRTKGTGLLRFMDSVKGTTTTRRAGGIR
jgi:hypothetical protein